MEGQTPPWTAQSSLACPMAWVSRCPLASMLTRRVKHNRAAECTRCNSLILFLQEGNEAGLNKKEIGGCFSNTKWCWQIAGWKGEARLVWLNMQRESGLLRFQHSLEYQSGQGTLVSDVQLRISRIVNAGITFILLSALVSSWSWQHWWELWFSSPHSWHTCSFSYSSSNLA